MTSDRILVFISHSTKDLIIVGGIKSSLQYYGFDTFIAHEDIDPSKEWQEEILKNLDSCDIFMPILTRNFQTSFWCDQESGIAFEKRKIIISLAVEIKPYGFLSRFQALKLNLNDITSFCKPIINSLKEDKNFKEKMKNCLIRSLLKSQQWEESNNKILLVKDMEPFDSGQITQIMKGFVENEELTGAFNVIDYVKVWIKKYAGLIEPGLKVQVENILTEKEEAEKSKSQE